MSPVGAGGDDAADGSNAAAQRPTPTVDSGVPLGIRYALSSTCKHQELEAIRTAAIVAMTNMVITIREKSQQVSKALSAADALKIANKFFSMEMLGGVHKRLSIIVRIAQSQNIALESLNPSQQRGLPTPMQAVFDSLAHLSSVRPRNSIASICHTINLVKFNEGWNDCLFHMSEGTPIGQEIISMLPPASVGKTRASRAKAILLEMLKMESTEWHSLMQASQIPTAMANIFGRGSVLFLKGGLSGNRNLFPYPSAAAQYFEAISNADPDNHITNAAKKLWEVVVKSLWTETVFGWDTATIVEIPNKGNLEQVLDLLSPSVKAQ
ncbi:hypothetical protein QBC34DRAFT_378440 [Podospora aff. communis PSN243]|uniref:Uncharacterized protein n=1 Tax=Podospora aff. communis PSN243 TaxID=3040156 RepID=A0AAV9GU28_9PEZI|nr:hypothetical protein QBC34DRAFT_378440 [Podospora aff. communis PSN243]